MSTITLNITQSVEHVVPIEVTSELLHDALRAGYEMTPHGVANYLMDGGMSNDELGTHTTAHTAHKSRVERLNSSTVTGDDNTVDVTYIRHESVRMHEYYRMRVPAPVVAKARSGDTDAARHLDRLIVEKGELIDRDYGDLDEPDIHAQLDAVDGETISEETLTEDDITT